ncbi:hypothetical protein C0585_04595 [Candidatus Woesearchaeota archaeon]|nr:MAG: hypothetical protein C0585_04595 [Candidatus Woesearchaeota archaeon]
MLNVYTLKCYDVENYDNKTHILFDLDFKEFEILLKKCIIESNKNTELVSRYSHFKNILILLEKNGGKIVYVDKSIYFLEDKCPIPNTSFWEKESIFRKGLKN